MPSEFQFDPSERLLDAARAELFSVSPERACGLSPSRCRHDIHMGDPFMTVERTRTIFETVLSQQDRTIQD